MRERSADPRFTRPRRRNGDDDHGCANHHDGRADHHDDHGRADYDHNDRADHNYVNVGAGPDPHLCGNGP